MLDYCHCFSVEKRGITLQKKSNSELWNLCPYVRESEITTYHIQEFWRLGEEENNSTHFSLNRRPRTKMSHFIYINSKSIYISSITGMSHFQGY
jgi:hypothetical protein